MVKPVRIGALVFLVSLLMAVGGLARPATAAPAETGAQPADCQRSSFVLYLSAGGGISLRCAGIYAVGRHADAFAAGAWSGVITYNGAATRRFCEGDRGDLDGVFVNRVQLYPRTAPWCLAA